MQGASKESELRHQIYGLKERIAELEGILRERERDFIEMHNVESALYDENVIKYRLLFDSTPLLIAWVDTYERYQAINSKYSEFFGVKPEEVVGKGIWEVIGDDMYNNVKGLIGQAMKSTMVEYEENVPDKNGEMHCVQGRIVPYHLSNGVQDGFVLFMEDITTRKSAEVKHEKLQKQLIQSHKMEAVGQLAGGVAHDFNNMLSVILGYAELGMMESDLSGKLYNHLSCIVKAADSSKGVTQQLLTFAREQTIDPQVLDLNKSIDGMIKMLRRLIGENIELELQFGSDLCVINFDPSQLDQILVNLCINASHAIAGIGKIIITTKNITIDNTLNREQVECESGEFVLLSVSDDGCGMDNVTIGKIFEPFFTTKPEHKGTGLGLSTVYGIVKQNNGFINVSSQLREGTTFKVYIPRYTGEVDEIKAGNAIKGCLEINDETVLVVEDEITLLELVKDMLENLGYTVLEATSPSQAISLAECYAGNINLLISDVVLPEMNGFDLANQLQNVYPDIKVLFMSGYTSNEIAKLGVIDKDANFISKPFSLEPLSSKVREALKCK